MKSKFWAVGLACFLLFCVAPASALASSISGIVTGEGAAPLRNATVCAQRISGEEVIICQNQTPASGEYTIENLAAGEYWVEFQPSYGSDYLAEHWNDVAFGGMPTTIELAEGEDLTGIDGELGKGGEIKGQVTALGGEPLSRAEICAKLVGGAGEATSCGQADEEGEYDFAGLIPGNYVVHFEGPSSGPAFRTSWWQGKSTEAEAEEISIAAGQVFTADAALEPVEGVIEGTLTAGGTSSFPTGSVCVFASGEEEPALECLAVSYNGHFAFGVEEGSYVLRYEDPGYTTLYSGGATAFDDAAAIPVTEGEVSSFPASADLYRPPGISGTVTEESYHSPIESGEACALVINVAPVCAPIGAGGAYSIPVGPGSYQVEFRSAGYANQFWDGAAREFEATPVEVTDRLVSGIDAELDRAETISGYVTSAAGGGALPGAEVCANPVGGGGLYCTFANGEGFYELNGLDGGYVMSFATGGYVTQYWNGVESEAQATPIAVDSEHSGQANAILVEAVSPTNTTPPTVSGTGKVGQTLTCNEGSWSGSPATFTYKYTWLRGTQTISGARSRTYTLATADAGQTIKCTVAATNTAGTATSVKSSNSVVVAALRRLTVTKAGNGSGTVTSVPAGISCGATCSLTISQGEVVVLTATPAAHMEFTGWTGSACAGTGTCEVTLGAANAAVTATFAQVTHAVSVTVSGGGSVSAATGAISGCTETGGTCSGTYNDGTEVILTATPGAHQQLSGWTGCTSTSGDECEVTAAAAENVTATFAPIVHELTVTKAGDGSGTVTSAPAGIDCGATCASAFEEGATVTLTATPAAHAEFTGWSGACTGLGACEVTVGSADADVTATFAQVTHAVSVTVSGEGSVSAGSGAISGCTEAGGTCSGTYDEGTEVTLLATPDAHRQLSGWTGCTTESGDECEVAVAAAENVTATFAPIFHELTVTKAGDGSGTVSSVPAGIDCGATCASGFEEGTVVTLTAVAESGSEFTGWSGACTGVGPCLVTLDSDQAVIAGFAVKPSEGGGGGSGETTTPPTSGAPVTTPPVTTTPIAPIVKPVKKKPLQCKKGFRKLKKKGKLRCVKVKPKHKHKAGKAERKLR